VLAQEDEKEQMLRELEAGVGPKIEPTTGDPQPRKPSDRFDSVSDGYAPCPYPEHQEGKSP
jgi:hypothetical protein